MKQTQVSRQKPRRGRADAEVFPLDPRDPAIVRAKALSRAARKPAAKSVG